MSRALITGASAGLGEQLAISLAARGWQLVITGRRSQPLDGVAAGLADHTFVTAIPGNVADAAHREALAAAVADGLDLLVNNASELGPSPLPALGQIALADLEDIYRINVFAPLALTQAVLPALRDRSGAVLNISSDAAVEPYPGWGGYGSSKAALDQISRVLGEEEAGLRVYAVDPGDMRTQMHQRAFPGEDISDRPEPATAVPGLLKLIDQRPPSGRYRVADLLADVPA